MFGSKKKSVIKTELDYDDKPAYCDEQYNFFVVCDTENSLYYYKDYNNACNRVLDIVMECIDEHNECVDPEEEDFLVYPTIADIRTGEYPYSDEVWVSKIDFVD